MALDVFHQVLPRLDELAGGNPRQMVSIVDVLKQEKLFGSAGNGASGREGATSRERAPGPPWRPAGAAAPFRGGP